MHSRRPTAAEPGDRTNTGQRAQGGSTSPLGLRPRDLLALQRSAGNRAVLARLGSAPAGFKYVINTGLRRKSRTDAYAKRARDYWADPANKDKPLKAYADVLIDDANAELKKMGSFEVKRAFNTTGSASGTFSRVTWTITINTTKFSNRAGITKVGQLTLDEAAEIADTIYHEVRHSEQYFRIARIRAAESKKTKADIAKDLEKDMSIPTDVAQAAAAVPMKKGLDVAYQIAEAKDWESITIGLHAEYKGIINTWGDEADAARDAALAVTAGNLAATKATIGGHVDAWRTGSFPPRFCRQPSRQGPGDQEQVAYGQARRQAPQGDQVGPRRRAHGVEDRRGQLGDRRRRDASRPAAGDAGPPCARWPRRSTRPTATTCTRRTPGRPAPPSGRNSAGWVRP